MSDNAESWDEVIAAVKQINRLHKASGIQSAQILELIRRLTELEQLAYSQSVLIQDLQEQAGKQFDRLREEQYAAATDTAL